MRRFGQLHGRALRRALRRRVRPGAQEPPRQLVLHRGRRDRLRSLQGRSRGPPTSDPATSRSTSPRSRPRSSAIDREQRRPARLRVLRRPARPDVAPGPAGLKIRSGAPTTRWASKLQKSDGTRAVADARLPGPQPVGAVDSSIFPIYYRPTVVYLGADVGRPADPRRRLRHRRPGRHHRDVRLRDPLDLLQPAFLLRRGPGEHARPSPRARRGMLRIASSTAGNARRPARRRAGISCSAPPPRTLGRAGHHGLARGQQVHLLLHAVAGSGDAAAAPARLPSTCNITERASCGSTRCTTPTEIRSRPATDRAAIGRPTPPSRPTRSSTSRRTSPAMSRSRPITGLHAQQDGRAHPFQHQGLERKLRSIRSRVDGQGRVPLRHDSGASSGGARSLPEGGGVRRGSEAKVGSGGMNGRGRIRPSRWSAPEGAALTARKRRYAEEESNPSSGCRFP